jgi:arylsulfatase A-like enzyme
MCSVALAEGECPDSNDQRRAWLGEDEVGRASLIEHAGSLALRMGKWKFIPQSNRPKVSKQVGIELGNDDRPQLYDLSKDLGETNNLAESEPERAAEMAKALESITSERR